MVLNANRLERLLREYIADSDQIPSPEYSFRDWIKKKQDIEAEQPMTYVDNKERVVFPRRSEKKLPQEIKKNQLCQMLPDQSSKDRTKN